MGYEALAAVGVDLRAKTKQLAVHFEAYVSGMCVADITNGINGHGCGVGVMPRAIIRNLRSLALRVCTDAVGPWGGRITGESSSTEYLFSRQNHF